MTEPIQTTARKAKRANLYHVNDFDEGMTRRRCGRGFTYLSNSGKTIKAAKTRERIESLVIPPAWTEVWICPRDDGHVQARGTDEAGRRQYIYHERWQKVSQAVKFDRMELFAEVLPRIRRRVRKDLSGKGVSRKRVLAAVVRLIDKSAIRIGNERYAKERGSRGATTITEQHVELDGHMVSLDFPGKSGQRREVSFTDRKLAEVVEGCQDLDGQYLFCYRDENGEHDPIASTDINTYLQEVSSEQISAKDFRTWWGSVTAIDSLSALDVEDLESDGNSAARQAVADVAETLGNTIAVCRKSYIHPGILFAAENGELVALLNFARKRGQDLAEMSIPETMLVQLIPKLKHFIERK